MKKKQPLSITEKLHPILLKNIDILKPAQYSEKYLLHVTDRDEGSDFFFQVTKQVISGGKLMYSYVQKPAHKDNFTNAASIVVLEDLIIVFESWISLIRKFNETQSIYDDPFLKSSEEYYAEQFSLADEDANYAAFGLDKQLLIGEYLAAAESRIEEFKVDKTPEEVKELDELITVASTLRTKLNKIPKAKVIKELATFWAKVQKASLPLVKDISLTLAKEYFKGLFLGDGANNG